MKSVAHKHKIVAVKWRDTMSFNGWRSQNDLEKPPVIETVGFLLEEHKTYIALAMSCGKYHYGEMMTIVRDSIVSITLLQARDEH